jgi:tubulin alpha
MLSSYSPIVNTRNADFQCMSTTYLCNQLYEPANMMAKCDHRHGKFLACTQIFRGNFTPKDIGACICTLKTRRNIRFVDWCPTGFKVGINYHAPMPAILGSNMADLQRSCCMISNSTSIKSVFARINHKFDDMYVKRAYVHSYLEEGMEQAELEEAREELARLEIDYYEIEKE